MNKSIIILSIATILLVSIATAAIYVVKTESVNGVAKASILNSNDPSWNLGFRNDAYRNVCAQHKNEMTSQALMQCYGFKAEK